MKFHQNLASSIGKLWNAREELQINNIRAGKVQYWLSYVLVLAFYNLRADYLFPVFYSSVGNQFMYNYEGPITYYAYSAITMAVVLLWPIKSNWFVKISPVVMFISVMCWLLVPVDIVKMMSMILCFLSLGAYAGAARYAYAYATNNAEKIIGAILITALNGTFRFLYGLGIENFFLSVLVPCILAAGLVATMIFYRTGEVKAPKETEPKNKITVYMAMAYMVAYFAVDMCFTFLPSHSTSLYVFNGSGFFIGVAIFIIIHIFFKRSIWHVWNVFFITSIITVLFGIFPENALSAQLSALFGGIRWIGYIASFYMLAGVQKRFADFKTFKICALLMIAVVPVLMLVFSVLRYLNLSHISAFVSMGIIVLIFIGFTLLSPMSYTHLFSSDWIEDFRRLDMSELAVLNNILHGEKAELLFTKDEIKTALLLVEGKMRSEITRGLHLTATEADRRINAIRDKIQLMGDPDPVIAKAAAEYKLSPRECDVLRCLRREITYSEIADELFLSEATVKVHVHNILKKMKISSRKEIEALLETFESPSAQ